MKMKELLTRLHREGFNDFSERMIRHYIDKGLLPEPDKPHANQAVYSEQHYQILKVIALLKRQNKSWLEIEAELDRLNLLYNGDEERLYASFQEGYMEELQCIDEWSKIDTEMQFFTREDLVSYVKCDEELLDYLIGSNLLPNKKYYDFSDMHLVRCIYYLKFFLDNYSDNKLGATEKFFNFIKKANALTDELADFTVEYYHSFLYSNLIKSMMFVKAKNMSYTSTETRKSAWSWDTTSISNFEEAQDYYSMGVSREDDFWVNYLKTINVKGLTMEELFEPVEREKRKAK